MSSAVVDDEAVADYAYESVSLYLLWDIMKETYDYKLAVVARSKQAREALCEKLNATIPQLTRGIQPDCGISGVYFVWQNDNYMNTRVRGAASNVWRDVDARRFPPDIPKYLQEGLHALLKEIIPGNPE